MEAVSASIFYSIFLINIWQNKNIGYNIYVFYFYTKRRMKKDSVTLRPDQYKEVYECWNGKGKSCITSRNISEDKKNCALKHILGGIDSNLLLAAVEEPKEEVKEKEIAPQEEYEYRKSIVEEIADEYGYEILFRRLERENNDGTRVRISKKSEFSDQNDGEGIILGPAPDKWWFRVRFDNGYENSYRMTDLVVLIKNENNSKDSKVINQEILQNIETESREDFLTNITKSLFEEMQKNKDLLDRMFPNNNFRKGDDVILNKWATDAYRHTHEWSTGKVISVSNNSILIRFDHITSRNYSGEKNPEWEIEAEYVINRSNPKEFAITLDNVKEKVIDIVESLEKEDDDGDSVNKNALTTKLLLKENFLLPGDGEGNYVLNYREMTKFVAPELYAAYGNKDIYSETDMCAPPSECHPNVLKMELSSWCDYNRCTYCDLYKNVKYCPKTFEQFKEHADKVMKALGEYKYNIERVFIGGGNALGVDQQTLEKSLKYVNNLLDPSRIAMYARTQDINRKGKEWLKKLNYAGLTNLYRWAETWSDAILKYVKKWTTLDDMLKASKELAKTDINLSVTLMPGIWGKRFDEENVKGTLKFLNATDTKFITFMAIMPSPWSEYDNTMKEEMMNNTNRPMTNVEVVKQIKTILKWLDPKEQKIGMYWPEVHEVDYNPFYFKVTFDRDGKREAIKLCDEYLKTHII